MMTFEYVDDETLEIFVDQEGKEALLKVLNNLNAPGDHDHLMTPAWSGHELSDEANNPAGKVIQMVTIGMPRTKKQRSTEK